MTSTEIKSLKLTSHGGSQAVDCGIFHLKPRLMSVDQVIYYRNEHKSGKEFCAIGYCSHADAARISFGWMISKLPKFCCGCKQTDRDLFMLCSLEFKLSKVQLVGDCHNIKSVLSLQADLLLAKFPLVQKLDFSAMDPVAKETLEIVAKL